MLTLEGTSYAADVAWVEELLAEHPNLRATNPEFHTRAGHLWVEVEGVQWTAHAWQVATQGRVMPSHVDRYRVRHQLVLGRVCVEVIDDPKKRGA